MSDEPDLPGELAGSVVRHAAGYIAGMLVTAGALQPDQKTQAATLIGSILLYAAVQGWSAARKILRAKRGA